MHSNSKLFFVILGAVLLAFLATAATADSVKVPRIGCASDGQMGPRPAPPNGEIALSIDPKLASGLALYSDGGREVLAPRGWHCFGVYGSNGASLFVTAENIPASRFFDSGWKGITGPGVQISNINGGTSGRFEAAEISAKIFPQQKNFVESVKAEGLAPDTDFSFGPYPNDKLKRIGANMVEYETPPGAKGLGTHTRLIPDKNAIKGVVIVYPADDNSIRQLAVRLPQDQSGLAAVIIHQTEQ